MTRIVAGVARGRRLSVPAGLSTRPTSDRAREALFSTVESALGPLAGARVVDFYAGSGAVGLEALSRGAAHVLLVEHEPKAVRAIKANIDVVGRPGAVLRAQSAESVTAGPPAQPYDLIFADPPYALPDADVDRLLRSLRDHGWLAAARSRCHRAGHPRIAADVAAGLRRRPGASLRRGDPLVRSPGR